MVNGLDRGARFLAGSPGAAVVAALAVSWSGCVCGPSPRPTFQQAEGGEDVNRQGDEPGHRRAREEMVRTQIEARGVRDPAVLEAMRSVPRRLFLPPELAGRATADSPQPIGLGQTISQPYIVAAMTELARAAPGERALDVGTGSGYQAAVLAEIVDRVYSIEILCELADAAAPRLAELGYDNVVVRCGDGYGGWPEAAPFDVIIVAAAPEEIPPALIEQLAPGGRLVIPVGPERGAQRLDVVEKDADGATRRWTAMGVRFVPMTGRAAETLR